MQDGYELMFNMDLEPDLIGRKVRLAEDSRDHRNWQGDGKIVGYDNGTGIVVVEVALGKEPRRYNKRELYLKDEPVHMNKTMKFAGKKFGALETFVKQAKLEGATADTVINPGELHWVSFVVELPLATEPEDGEW